MCFRRVNTLSTCVQAMILKSKAFIKDIAQIRDNRRAARKAERVRKAIDTVIDGLGVTQIELSVAFDLSAPKRGERGTAMVTAWRGGYSNPGKESLVTLELLAQGLLRLRQTGKDGRRRLFDVEHLPCPHCTWVLRRRGDFDSCDDCGHKQPADDGVLVVDQGGTDGGDPGLRDAVVRLAADLRLAITSDEGQTAITLTREQHELVLTGEGCASLRWRYSAGDREWSGDVEE